jgi:hypothetical protein
VRHAVRVSDADLDPVDYFARQGYDVRITERELHDEHVAAGQPGRASFYVAGRRYFCVDLLRDQATVVERYAEGATREAALQAARRRFGSEQA